MTSATNSSNITEKKLFEDLDELESLLAIAASVRIKIAVYDEICVVRRLMAKQHQTPSRLDIERASALPDEDTVPVPPSQSKDTASLAQTMKDPTKKNTSDNAKDHKRENKTSNVPKSPSDIEENKKPDKSPPVTLAATVLQNYGWDESNATLKLYIDIPRLPPNAVHVTTSDFTSFAVHLRLKIGDKEYCFSLKNLAHEIIPEETNMKLKKGRIVILAKKKTCGIWKGITAFDANRNEQRQERTKEEEVDDEQSFLGVSEKKIWDKVNQGNEYNHFCLKDRHSAIVALKHIKQNVANNVVLYVKNPDSCIDILEKILHIVSSIKCGLALRIWSLWKPHKRDGSLFKILHGQRCTLSYFAGFLKPNDIQKYLSRGLKTLSLAITDSNDAKALGNYRPPVTMHKLNVVVHRGVDPSDLRPLQLRSIISYGIGFAGVTDECIPWVIKCCAALCNNYKGVLVLPKSQLTDEGAFSLLKNVPMKLKYLFVGSAIEKPPITITVQDFDGDISKRTLVWKAHEAIEKNEIYFEEQLFCCKNTKGIQKEYWKQNSSLTSATELLSPGHLVPVLLSVCFKTP